MKRITIYFPLLMLSFCLLFAACQPNTEVQEQVEEEKIVDIPVSTKSEEAKAAIYKGLNTWDLGSEKDAHAFFTQALKHDPKLALAHAFAGATQGTTKAFVDGIANAKANLAGASEFEKQQIQLMETYNTNDSDARLALAKKMAVDYPGLPRCEFTVGNTHWQRNEVALSRESYKKAIAIDPSWARAHMSLASSYLFAEPKDLAKAESTAAKVVAMVPNNARAHILLGDCYRGQDKLEKARDAYSKAVELDAKDSQSYYKKGHANTFLGNLDEARADFQAGRQYDDDKNFTFEANLFSYDGKSQEALNWLEGKIAGIESQGFSPDRLNDVKLDMLGDCAWMAFHLKNPAKLKALKDQEEVLSEQKAKDVGTAEAMIDHETDMMFWEALIASLNGKTDDAASLLDKYKTAREPLKNPRKLLSYHFASGIVLLQKKDYKGAAAEFEQANGDWLYNQYWKAKAYELSGEKDKAYELYNKVAGNNFNSVFNGLVRKEVKQKITI